MTIARQLWVLAGGNGAGKSTFYRLFLEKQGIKLINADLIAKQIDAHNPEAVSYDAATVAEYLRHDLLAQGLSFCFETVFSHPSKIDFLARAKALGYEVILIFIHLADSRLNEARVHQRVQEGGHNVPAEKIRSRIPRTLRHIATVLPLVDQARLLDNTFHDQYFRQVAVLKHGHLVWKAASVPDWAHLLLAGICAERPQ